MVLGLGVWGLGFRVSTQHQGKYGILLHRNDEGQSRPSATTSLASWSAVSCLRLVGPCTLFPGASTLHLFVPRLPTQGFAIRVANPQSRQNLQTPGPSRSLAKHTIRCSLR